MLRRTIDGPEIWGTTLNISTERHEQATYSACRRVKWWNICAIVSSNRLETEHVIIWESGGPKYQRVASHLRRQPARRPALKSSPTARVPGIKIVS